ncbi:hypothetical protein SAMN05444266_110125 [Chitinophaga jiangningensis]|uniref:N-acetyltransferase domain-containing protein n=2 Tax=Chitinophaga jiangningensis TaxID=1419482 RepID=A0A1M7L438_9BACT|nr:hypothetical protein SAMN05444266_110125 [Chitinophaga jiangningensis]
MATGLLLDAVIEPVKIKDFKIIEKSKDRFNKFDWTLYRKEEVFKLTLKGKDTILGLICLIDHTKADTDAIEIELVEVACENIGGAKQYDFIGGCLFAFACRESIRRGHNGFVFLVPKSGLVTHYKEHYGFEHFPLKTPQRPCGLMVLHEHASKELVTKYLSEF